MMTGTLPIYEGFCDSALKGGAAPSPVGGPEPGQNMPCTKEGA